MVELEYNGERYMVYGGQWYRRLKVGEVVNFVNQMRSSLDGKWVQCSPLIGGIVSSCEVNDYRVPCTDPRPPFVVGQRVKVARKDDSCHYWTLDMNRVLGHDGMIVEKHESPDDECCLVSFGYNGFVFPPWCLDPVEPTFGEKIIDRMEKFTEELEASDIDHELDHILKKLKSHADRAADVRRIKRECYQKLAALLPEEKR